VGPLLLVDLCSICEQAPDVGEGAAAAASAARACPPPAPPRGLLRAAPLCRDHRLLLPEVALAPCSAARTPSRSNLVE